MSHLLTNVTLRANGLPTLTPDQLDLLAGDEPLAREFASALDRIERERIESTASDSFDLACEPTAYRATLRAIIGELSLQRPAAHPEIATAQAQVRIRVGG